MELASLSLVLSIVAIIIAIYTLFKRPAATAGHETSNNTALRLQAYERLVLLTERISLPNLISRLNQPGISAYEMKIILNENMKQEFEYNSTQQLYVSPVSWDAVRTLKEQNIMLVNKVAANLPDTASAGDLNKRILELFMSQQGESPQELVLKTLNFEAKKLMK
jgi:hypothetical protein